MKIEKIEKIPYDYHTDGIIPEFSRFNGLADKINQIIEKLNELDAKINTE